MGVLNVLVFSTPNPSRAEQSLHDRLLEKLEREPRVEFAAVSLPRAEAMLVPRLVGLWSVFVFVGGSGKVTAPANPAVLDAQEELIDVLPPIAVVGHPADLWPGWVSFQSHLYRCGADRTSIDPDSDDALNVVWDRIMVLATSSLR
jgi:hypothetical protein